MDVSMSVGGHGVVAAPVYARVPCDQQAGFSNPHHMTLAQDTRAPGGFYSATPNQTGGGEAYPPSCYIGTGSEMPVYQAGSAGFRFEPASSAGANPAVGTTDYMNVVPVLARTGGARKTRRYSRRSRK